MDVAKNDEFGIISGTDHCEDKTVKKLLCKKLNGAIDYLTPKTRLEFTQLKKAFIKAPIFQHFNPKCYISIKTDMSSYVIGEVLSQLTLDNLGQWHLVAYYS